MGWFSRKKSDTENSEIATVPQNADSDSDSNNDPVIRTDLLPAGAIQDESRLVEIKDSRILGHINALIPWAVQAAGISGAVSIANQLNQTAGKLAKVSTDFNKLIRDVDSSHVYRAVLPKGAELVQSKDMAGAVRGMYRGVDNKFAGHANFMEVNFNHPDQVAVNSVSPVNPKGPAFAASAMAVASMVVGQYYMEQINSQLDEINEGISGIQNFLDNEYKSRVFSLVSHVKSIAEYKAEILENDELRLSKIVQLNSLEEEATQLLGQANLTIAQLTEKDAMNYGEYEKTVKEVNTWLNYQKQLDQTLCVIADLRYTLHFGAVSREQCSSVLAAYGKDTDRVNRHLSKWHKQGIKHLGIQTWKNRRKKEGLDQAITYIPGIFIKDWNFAPMDKKTVEMILTQKAGYNRTEFEDHSELYSEDVQLILKDGKIYYLPESELLQAEDMLEDSSENGKENSAESQVSPSEKEPGWTIGFQE